VEDLREHETIPVKPLGVFGVEPHELVEQDVGDRCHAPEKTSVWMLQGPPGKNNSHRGTGVTGVGIGGGIGLETCCDEPMVDSKSSYEKGLRTTRPVIASCLCATPHGGVATWQTQQNSAGGMAEPLLRKKSIRP
jgi:hypothetical protein